MKIHSYTPPLRRNFPSLPPQGDPPAPEAYEPSLLSSIAGGAWGAVAGADAAAAAWGTFGPALGLPPDIVAQGALPLAAGALAGCVLGARGGFARTAVSSVGGLIAGHLTLAATHSPLLCALVGSGTAAAIWNSDR